MATHKILLTVLCAAYLVGLDAAKGNVNEVSDLLSLQRQFTEFRLQQDVATKLTDDKINHLENLVRSQFETISEQERRIATLESTLKNGKNKRLVMNTGLVESGRIAFSAYLDHDVDGVVNQQKIVFNKANYNEGNFYNVSSGIFTAPMKGVYLFIYFIGNRHAREVDAELVLNGVKQNEAVAEGVGVYHDTQGGNSAVLKLNPGDMVWIDTTLGDHVEGNWWFSSFTGALLYPVDLYY